MNAQEYCEMVEHKYREHKMLLPTIVIKENNSPLISLKNSGLNLMFEPSVKKEYNYRVREEIYEKIGRISRKLNSHDKVLIIRSVWRSFKHQRILWEEKVASFHKEHPEKEMEEIEEQVSYFIAPPEESMHSTGGAVDALLYDLKKECIMDFGTNKGLNIELSDKCYPYYPYIPTHARNNRKLLIDLFEEEDFTCDIKEYWHFDYGTAGWAVEKGKKEAFYGIIRE